MGRSERRSRSARRSAWRAPMPGCPSPRSTGLVSLPRRTGRRSRPRHHARASRSRGSWRAHRRAGAAPRRCSGWPRSQSRAGRPNAWSRSDRGTARRPRRTATDPNQGGRPWAKAGSRLRDSRQWQHPFGVAALAHEMALIARRHMHVRSTPEHFGDAGRRAAIHASRNPDAIMRDEITLDDWAASRPIAEPIRLFDCSLENDGAVAVLVTSFERACDLAQPAVPVLGQVQYGAPIHTELAEFFATTAAFGERDAGAVAAGRRLVRRRGRHARRRRRRADRRSRSHSAVPLRVGAVRLLRDGRGRAVHRERRDPLARRCAAGEHARRIERRGVRARREPSPGGGAATARDRVQSGRRRGGRVRVRGDQRPVRARCCSESTGERGPTSRAGSHRCRRRRFWAALRDGELRIQRCAACGAFRHPPRPSARAAARPDASGSRRRHGRVWSFTVVHPPTLAGVRRPHALRRGRRPPRRGRVPRQQPGRLPGRGARGRYARRVAITEPTPTSRPLVRRGSATPTGSVVSARSVRDVLRTR